MKPYSIKYATQNIALSDGWNAESRSNAEILEIENFRVESSGHRPRTRLKMQWDDNGLNGIFHVQDKYVLAVNTEFNSSVCRDSCVEFFVQPAGGVGYVNFEFNCCGTMLISHVEDETRLPEGGFKKWRRWTEEEGSMVATHASLKGPITEEIAEDTTWTLAFSIPFAPLLAATGAPAPAAGAEWRANFYKCGDATTHPHWASWAPVSEKNFHLPGCFETIKFS